MAIHFMDDFITKVLINMFDFQHFFGELPRTTIHLTKEMLKIEHIYQHLCNEIVHEMDRHN
jgi:hypothetical protein